VKASARLTTILVAGASLSMLGLTFAAEPLYSTFCRMTGFGGTTQRSIEAPTKVLDRMVRVRLDANVEPGVALKFKPEQEFVDLKVGQKGMVMYDVTNTSDKPITAIPTYNVAPDKAGIYFTKMQCFCFNEKTFAPGVTERLPVIFFVKPEIADDKKADDIDTITLSYTYFRVPEPKGSARLEDASAVY
jgi:cytochrome c oxidase assembly protein subunit 11